MPSNLSLSFLALSLLTRSPFCALAPTCARRSFLCRRSHLSHFAQPFLISHSAAAAFRQTTFSSFLSRAVRVGAKCQLSGEIVLERRQYPWEGLEFEFCQFLRIQPGGGSGGALESSVPTRLFNCLFHECHASEGGALVCHSDLSMQFVSTWSCAAHSCGALAMRGESLALSLICCHFFNTQAQIFGVLFRFSKGEFRIESTNYTHCRGAHCCGCMESKFGTMEMRFSVIAETSAVQHNGAICTRQLDELTYEFCHFINISHCSSDFESAAVLLCYENAYDSAIVNSTFVGNDPNASLTVKVVGGHLLLFIGCSFSGKRERELGQDLMKTVDCRFEEWASPPEPREQWPGFDPKMSGRPVATPEAPAVSAGISGSAVVVGRKGKTAAGVLLCVVIALAVATMVTLLQVGLKNEFHHLGKSARAIV
jgi:hypothetical protein